MNNVEANSNTIFDGFGINRPDLSQRFNEIRLSSGRNALCIPCRFFDNGISYCYRYHGIPGIKNFGAKHGCSNRCGYSGSLLFNSINNGSKSGARRLERDYNQRNPGTKQGV